MLSVTLDREHQIAILRPSGLLTKADFITAASEIDDWIQQSGKLKGLLIHSQTFPGWDSFSAIRQHIFFIREHHRKVSRVALATDSFMGLFFVEMIRRCVKPELKLFAFHQLEAAKLWLSDTAAKSC